MGSACIAKDFRSSERVPGSEGSASTRAAPRMVCDHHRASARPVLNTKHASYHRRAEAPGAAIMTRRQQSAPRDRY